jgi:hypothetical protein
MSNKTEVQEKFFEVAVQVYNKTFDKEVGVNDVFFRSWVLSLLMEHVKKSGFETWTDYFQRTYLDKN